MSLAFNKPYGAAADIKELEYVSALHQTVMPNVNLDGSIKDVDISTFLASRYRIYISPEEVRSKILYGLGGGNSEDDCIDLTEMLALLLIPTLIKASRQDDTDKEDLALAPPKGLLQYVLNIILHDFTNSIEPKQLDKEMLAMIFRSYGEKDMADDDNLLEEMIATAGGGKVMDEEAPILMLDKDSFSHALTSDLQLYDIENEFKACDIHEERKDIIGESHKSYLAAVKSFFKLEWISKSVDSISETYPSPFLFTYLWAIFIIYYYDNHAHYQKLFSSLFGGTCKSFSTVADPGEFLRCQVPNSIEIWVFKLIFAGMLGLLLVSLPSIGNNMDGSIFFSMLGLLLTSTFPVFLILILEYLNGGDTTEDKEFLYYMIIILLIGALSCHLRQILSLLIPDRFLKKNPKLLSAFKQRVCVNDVYMRESAAFKVLEMLNNALDISTSAEDTNSVVNTYFGRNLLGFSKLGEKSKRTGGFVWVIRNMWNNDLRRKEGIWISAKVQANFLTFCVVTVFIIWYGITMTVKTASNKFVEGSLDFYFKYYIEKASKIVIEGVISDINNMTSAGGVSGIITNFLVENLERSSINCSSALDTTTESYIDSVCLAANCSLLDEQSLCGLSNIRDTAPAEALQGILERFGFNFTSIIDSMELTVESKLQVGFNAFYPSNHITMILLPMIVFAVTSAIVSLFLTIIYVPSTVVTTLKLRCGVIPTFNDPQFSYYRSSPDKVSLLSGSLFWGLVFSSSIIGGLAGFVAFFFLFQKTRGIVVRVIATVIGILVTLAVKDILLILFRRNFKGFYRSAPGRTSLISLFLEAVDFSLSIFTSATRVVTLTFTSILYVGRVDTPLLSPNISKSFDPMPHTFIKDILLHDAHRHPYISLLGTLYLSKLKYGTKFINQPGSAWRLLFVFALFPWVSKYRILGKEELKEEELKEEDKLQNDNSKKMHNLSIFTILGSEDSKK